MITTSAFLALALQCAPSIHPATLTPIIKTESAFNPYAIGVVGKSLPHQPQSMDEAVMAVKALVKEGANFSIGLGQINRQHFDVNQPAQMFDPCNNLRMTAVVLQKCYAQASKGSVKQQAALQRAISCYYSGNQERGFQPEPQFGSTSHVQRVLANAESTDVMVPALTGAPGGATAQPAVPPVQPSYESWDVMRQYPRYVPLAQPQSPAPKPQAPKTPKENFDD